MAEPVLPFCAEEEKKKGDVIYEPSGRAAEYSPLALNLYDGCRHACLYCYASHVKRITHEKFSSRANVRKDILKRLESDCKKMSGDPRQILLCFTSDPYQPQGCVMDVTRDALLILEKYHMNATVLTKGGLRAAGDFDILKRNDWPFGTTLSFSSQKSASYWEPGAAWVHMRKEAIKIAHDMGVRTWVSVEPVIIPDEALAIMDELKDIVDTWKVGKINHNAELEKTLDWTKFLTDTEHVLAGKDLIIKNDLEMFRGSRPCN